MKGKIVFGLLCILALGTAFAAEKKIWAKSVLNQKAPDFVVEKWLSAQPDTQGKFVLIDFWATWCGPCRRAIPELNAFQKKFAGKLVVIGVSDEPEDTVSAFTNPKIEYSSAIDTQKRMNKALEISGIPHCILIDPKGIVRWEGFPLLEGQELTETVVADVIAKYSIDPRKVRLLELLLVLFVAFSASIVASLYQFFGGERPPTQAGDIRWIYGSLRELATLGVLAYVLFRQGRGFAGIGARWKLTDIPMTLVLLAAAYGGYVVWVLGVEQRFIPPGQEIARQAQANRHLLEGGASVAAVLFMIINGFFEEFIVRAFVITQLKQLTGSAAFAIFASVTIQVSYHLYQGLPAALSHVPMFLIFSIYYQRTNRIFPVAMAHVTMDLLILFHHVMAVS